MKTWYQYFYDIVAVILFCAGVTFLFFGEKQLAASYRNMQKFTEGNRVLYETEGETVKIEAAEASKKVTKPELIGILTAGLSYDVEIEGEYYKKEDFTPLLFDFFTLSSNYRRTYVFEEKSGRIQYVKYQREGG